MSENKLRTFHMNFCVSDEEAKYAIRNEEWKERIKRLMMYDFTHALTESLKPTFYHYHNDNRYLHNVIAEIEIPEKYIVNSERENVYNDKNIASAIKPGWMVGCKMWRGTGWEHTHLSDVYAYKDYTGKEDLKFLNDDGLSSPLFILDDCHITILNPMIYYIYKPNQQGDYIKVWERSSNE